MTLITRDLYVEFSEREWNPLFLSEDWLRAVGGVGVTAEAVEQRNDGFHLENPNIQRTSTALLKSIKISRETPVSFIT
jgi:hypothetical protein